MSEITDRAQAIRAEAQKQVDQVLNRFSKRRQRRDQLVALIAGFVMGVAFTLPAAFACQRDRDRED